jgi:hypothetical protein
MRESKSIQVALGEHALGQVEISLNNNAGLGKVGGEAAVCRAFCGIAALRRGPHAG